MGLGCRNGQMTETLLNLLWVFIAVAAVVTWRVRWARERPVDRRNGFREWTALACSLVLLFFAVSLSDDLHEEVILSDLTSVGRKQAICFARSHSSNEIQKLTSTHNWTVLPPQAPAIHSAVFWLIPFVSDNLPAPVTTGFLPVRAPPAF